MKIITKLFTIIFLLAISTGTGYGQTAYQLEKIQESYRHLKAAYYGRDINGKSVGNIEIQNIREIQTKTIKSNDALIKGKYSIFLSIVAHINFALNPGHKEPEACDAITSARRQFIMIDSVNSFLVAEGIKLDYQKTFGITLEMIDQFFESKYCVNYKITKDSDCLFGKKKDLPKKKVKHQTSDTAVQKKALSPKPATPAHQEKEEVVKPKTETSLIQENGKSVPVTP